MATRKFQPPPQTEFLFDVSAGRIAWAKGVSTFGSNHDVDAGVEAVWTPGGLYTGFLTSPDSVVVRAGGNAADTLAGAGAQKVRIRGLDANFEEAEEEIELAGAAESAPTTTQFIRVNCACVSQVGTYGAANTGDIQLETDASGVLLAQIDADRGQAMMAVFTVPAGYTAVLKDVEFNAPFGDNLEFRMYQRRQADVVSGAMMSKQLVREVTQSLSYAPHEYKMSPSFPEKTDLWVEVESATANNAANASFDLVLVKN